jgi:uroporphyrinogen-III decarboxylase
MTQSPISIPWSVAFAPETYCEYCGVALTDYHGDVQTMMDVQLAGTRIVNEKFDLSQVPRVYPDFSVYAGATVLGLELQFQPDQPPSPLGHPLQSAEEAARLELPDDLTAAGLIPRMIQFYDYMKTHAPQDVAVGFGTGTQGPFTTAVLLRGNGIFLDIYEAPDLVHRFLQTVTENSIRLRELSHQMNGTTDTSVIGYADDYGGLLSPEHYQEFVLPYLLQIADHFGATTRNIHAELVRREHLPLLQDAGFSFIDVGANPYLTVKDCAEVLDVDFLMYMYTCRKHLLSNPEQVKAVYRQMVADGARRMACDVCPGVPDDNIRAFIEVAREYE